MTLATHAYGTFLQLGDGLIDPGPEGFTTIAECKNITPPQLAQDALDATNQDTPNGYREFIGGLKDGGSVAVEANWIPDAATHISVLAAFSDGLAHNFKIVFPGAVATWSFTALITSFNTAAPVDNILGLSLTLKVTGEPTFV